MKPLLTIAETAKLLNISHVVIRDLAKSGKLGKTLILNPKGINKTYRICRSELKRLKLI